MKVAACHDIELPIAQCLASFIARFVLLAVFGVHSRLRGWGDCIVHHTGRTFGEVDHVPVSGGDRPRWRKKKPLKVMFSGRRKKSLVMKRPRPHLPGPASC